MAISLDSGMSILAVHYTPLGRLMTGIFTLASEQGLSDSRLLNGSVFGAKLLLGFDPVMLQ